MNALSVIKLLPESNEQVLKFSNELNDILNKRIYFIGIY